MSKLYGWGVTSNWHRLGKASIAAIVSLLLIASLVGAAPGSSGGESILGVPQQVTELQAEVAELSQMVAVLSDALTAESAARTALEAVVAAEQAARAHADDLLAYNIATEAMQRADADTQLQQALAAEVSARVAGDAATLAAAMTYADQLVAPQPMTEAEIRAEVTAMWPACTPATANGWQCLPGLENLQFAVGAPPTVPGAQVTVRGQIYTAPPFTPLAYAGMPIGIYVTSGSVDPQIVMTDGQGAFSFTFTAPADPMRIDVKVITALNTRTAVISVYGEPAYPTFGYNHTPTGVRGRMIAHDANSNRVPNVTIHYTTSTGLSGTDTTDYNGFGTEFIDLPYGSSITMTLDGTAITRTHFANPLQ